MIEDTELCQVCHTRVGLKEKDGKLVYRMHRGYRLEDPSPCRNSEQPIRVIYQGWQAQSQRKDSM